MLEISGRIVQSIFESPVHLIEMSSCCTFATSDQVNVWQIDENPMMFAFVQNEIYKCQQGITDVHRPLEDKML